MFEYDDILNVSNYYWLGRLDRIIVWFVFLLVSINAAAEQISFNKTESDAGITLSYQWTDHFEQNQSIDITLPQDKINNLYRSVKNYMPDIAQRYVYIELMKAAQKVDPREARIRLRKLGLDTRITVSGRSPELIRKWQQTMETSKSEAFERYLKENYYTTFKTHYGKEAVKPDHIRYLNESRELLMPVAQAFFDKVGQGNDTRDYANMLLSWIQSIPYNELEDKSVSRGSGYLSPAEVLTNNIGDCDSKTTLMASLMRSLLPNVSQAIVYLPGHALLAANLPRRDTEHTIELDGMRYLLLEPTGPALMPIGEIGDKSAKDIASGMYTFEKVQ